MTKTLTEQWREGTLPDDTYYWKVCKENWIADKYEMYDYTKVYDVSEIECLAPVPSYEQFIGLMDDSKELDKAYDKINLLEKKLKIATRALKEYDNKLNWDIRGVSFMKYNKGFTIARKALKEMEGVE